MSAFFGALLETVIAESRAELARLRSGARTHECAGCGASYVRQDPVTFGVRGFLYADRGFCSEACAGRWAMGEAARLRRFLQRIHTSVTRASSATALARRALDGCELDDEKANQ